MNDRNYVGPIPESGAKTDFAPSEDRWQKAEGSKNNELRIRPCAQNGGKGLCALTSFQKKQPGKTCPGKPLSPLRRCRTHGPLNTGDWSQSRTATPFIENNMPFI